MNLRIRALERRKLPEELDQLSGLARPWAWLGIAAVALAVAALVAWSFFGRIPRTVSGVGVIAVPGSVAAISSTVSGPVEQVNVNEDAFVSQGQTLAVIRTSNGQSQFVTAPFSGQIVDLQVIPGQVVTAGTQMFTMQRSAPTVQGKVAYLFVPASDASGLAPGMTVNITLSTAPTSVYGVLHGKILSVSVTPLSTAAVTALVANPDLAQSLTKSGPPLLAQVKLIHGATRSGFAWSTPKGPPFPIEAGTPLTAQIVQTQQRPIDVVFGTS